MRNLNLKSQALLNALSLIDKIYKESMYGRNDMFRIQDIIDSLSAPQWESKEILVSALQDVMPLSKSDKIYVIGGWYGLLSALLAEVTHAEIFSIDIDPFCEQYGKQIFNGNNFHFKNESLMQVMIEGLEDVDVIISTSCEHFEAEELKQLITMKPDDTIIALQSNDYVEHSSHINTHPTLDSFINSLDIDVIYQNETTFDMYKRYTVIGK